MYIQLCVYDNVCVYSCVCVYGGMYVNSVVFVFVCVRGHSLFTLQFTSSVHSVHKCCTQMYVHIQVLVCIHV